METPAGGLSQIIQAPEVFPVECRRRLHFDSDELPARLCLLKTLSGVFGIGKVTIIGARDIDIVRPLAQSGVTMFRSQNTTPITRRR